MGLGFYRGLQEVARSDRGLLEVRGGYKGLQGLQEATRDSKG